MPESHDFINNAVLCYLLSHFLEMGGPDTFDTREKNEARRKADLLGQRDGFNAASWRDVTRCLLEGKWTEKPASMQLHEWYSLRYSHPRYMVARLVSLVGIDRTKLLLQHHQQEERFYVLLKDEIAGFDFLKYLKSRRFVFQRDRTFPNLIHVPSIPGWKHDVVSRVIARRDDIIIQDLGSVAAVEALGIREGDTVLDACAAPFQKTRAMSWKCKQRGLIVAIDRDVTRMACNLERTNAGTWWYALATDSTWLDRALRGFTPNKVLIDAPCSGSGSIGGYPELKFMQDEKTVARHTGIQRDICAAMINAAKQWDWKNTEFLYSTCSYYPEEGEDIIDQFSADISLVDLHDPHVSPVARAGFSTGWKGYSCSTKVVRTFPDKDFSRAFFLAKFKVRI